MSGEISKMSREDAIARFREGRPALDSAPVNEFDKQMREQSVGLVALSVSKGDFQYLHNAFDTILDEPEYGGLLKWTRGNFNREGVPEDGHVRKELSFNEDGQQKSDPKDIFHVNDSLLAKYRAADKSKMPQEFTDFMETAIEIRHEVGKATLYAVSFIAEAYPGMNEFISENGLTSFTMREVRYDAFDPDMPTYYRAKEHDDRGFATLQADETSAGLWRKLPGQKGEEYPPIAVPHNDGYARFFFGTTMDVLYEQGMHPIGPMTHGVYGPEPGDGTRNSNILFADPPRYDMKITSLDTQPHRRDTHNLDI